MIRIFVSPDLFVFSNATNETYLCYTWTFNYQYIEWNYLWAKLNLHALSVRFYRFAVMIMCTSISKSIINVLVYLQNLTIDRRYELCAHMLIYYRFHSVHWLCRPILVFHVTYRLHVNTIVQCIGISILTVLNFQEQKKNETTSRREPNTHFSDRVITVFWSL